MSDTPLKDELCRTPEGRREYQREYTYLEVSEMLWMLMKRDGVSGIELARRIGCTKAHVSHILSGKNITLRTISDILTALGYELLPITVRKIEAK